MTDINKKNVMPINDIPNGGFLNIKLKKNKITEKKIAGISLNDIINIHQFTKL